MLRRMIWILIGLLALAGSVNATMQVKDNFIYEGQEGELDVDWSFPTPFQIYYLSDPMSYPFRSTNTANYRGHIATWSVIEGEFFLTKLHIEESTEGGRTQKELALNDYFPEVGENGVHANWFTGMLKVQINPYEVWFENPYYPGQVYIIEYETYVFLEVQEGRVVRRLELTGQAHAEAMASLREGQTPEDETVYEMITGYFSYIREIGEIREASEEEAYFALLEWLDQRVGLDTIMQLEDEWSEEDLFAFLDELLDEYLSQK